MRPVAMIAAALALTAASPPRTTVRVPYWAQDGGPATAVVAKVDGQPAKVRARGAGHEMLLLVVLDLAGDLALVDPAREALVAEVEKLPANAYVGLLRAQDGLRVLRDPDADRGAFAASVRELNISGRAGLLDTVEQAAQLGDSVAAKANVRVAVLYVSDSTIGNYREDYTNPVVNSNDSRDMSRRFPEGLVKEKISQLSASLAVTETPLFLVHLNYQNDRLNEAYQTGLLELATASGGTATFCRSVAEIPQAIEQAFQTVRGHHSAEIALPPVKGRQVDVELSAEGRELHYRQRITLRK
jgi:hypothetical protein